ncbi:hypothetical protein BDC45DRAFT_562626 [Circinella umbellata]|nr:hypothetical protein BDC45DRAFT_562626 [Circinella umbellata]
MTVIMIVLEKSSRMPTIGERNAARAQRSMDHAKHDLEIRVEAMGNVIAMQALAQQQEVQLQLPVSQDDVVFDNQVHGPGDVSAFDDMTFKVIDCRRRFILFLTINGQNLANQLSVEKNGRRLIDVILVVMLKEIVD